MTRSPRLLYSVLLVPLLIYLLPPFFGAVGHDLVPEHDHLFLNPSNAFMTSASKQVVATAVPASPAATTAPTPLPKTGDNMPGGSSLPVIVLTLLFLAIITIGLGLIARRVPPEK